MSYLGKTGAESAGSEGLVKRHREDGLGLGVRGGHSDGEGRRHRDGAKKRNQDTKRARGRRN